MKPAQECMLGRKIKRHSPAVLSSEPVDEVDEVKRQFDKFRKALPSEEEVELRQRQERSAERGRAAIRTTGPRPDLYEELGFPGPHRKLGRRGVR